jgi:5-methylcytosine-specific restriction endonuclease McrA
MINYKKIREKLGNKCCVCDWPFKSDLHHIIARNKGGRSGKDNFILLCPNHHRLIHQDIITIEQIRLNTVPKHLICQYIPVEEVKE